MEVVEESTTIAVNIIDIDIKEVSVEYDGSSYSPTDSKYFFLRLVFGVMVGMLIGLLIVTTRKPKLSLGLSQKLFLRVPRLALLSSSKGHSMIAWLVSSSDGSSLGIS